MNRKLNSENILLNPFSTSGVDCWAWSSAGHGHESTSLAESRVRSMLQTKRSELKPLLETDSLGWLTDLLSAFCLVHTYLDVKDPELSLLLAVSASVAFCTPQSCPCSKRDVVITHSISSNEPRMFGSAVSNGVQGMPHISRRHVRLSKDSLGYNKNVEPAVCNRFSSPLCWIND
jgi:hypothetical protein